MVNASRVLAQNARVSSSREVPAHESQEELEAILLEDREAKLAELRAAKAALLQAKARKAAQQTPAALAEAKEHDAKLSYLAEGKLRGLKGFALSEYADAKLAETKQCTTVEESQVELQNDAGDQGELKAPVTLSCPQDASNAQDTDHGIKSHHKEDEDGIDFFFLRTAKEIEEQQERQLAEECKRRREEGAKFVASLQGKNKSTNRKGHRTRKGEMPGLHRAEQAPTSRPEPMSFGSDPESRKLSQCHAGANVKKPGSGGV